MWNVRMYEWLANDRIAAYRREAAQDRRLRLVPAAPRRPEKTPSTARTVAPSSRRALAAAFIGLAVFGMLRRRP
ncbi:MAG TPA: hypothetical protein VGX75_10580 [bacterium]|nr:hypothetical protein [bacterium]